MTQARWFTAEESAAAALAVAQFWSGAGASRVASRVSQWRDTGVEKGVQGGFFWPGWLPAGLREIDADNLVLVRSMWLALPKQDPRDGGAGRRRLSTYWRPLDSDNAPPHRLIFLDDIKSLDPFRDYKHAILETSSGNYQGWFVVQESVSPEARLSIQKLICRKFNADPGAGGSMRWTRMPGSINYKPGKDRFATRLVSINNDGRFMEIPEPPAIPSNHAPRAGAVSALSRGVTEHINQPGGEIADFIQGWRPRGADQSDSARDFAATLSLLRRGYSPDAIFKALVEIASARGKPKPEYYSNLTVIKAAREITRTNPPPRRKS